MSLYPYYSRYYDYPNYRYSSLYDPYYYPRYPYYSRYYPSTTSYVSYDSPTRTEYKDVSPGKVTTTTVDKSAVSPALDRTVTTTTYTDPYPAYSYRYPYYSRYYDYPYYSRYYADPYYYPSYYSRYWY